MKSINKVIVLYIGSMHHGGAERVMSVLANYFAGIGYRVILATDIEVKKDKNNYEVMESIKCVHIKSRSKNAIIKNIERIRELRRTIKENDADVILSFMRTPNYRMLISTIGMRCRKCVSVRNDPNKDYGVTIIKKKVANFIMGMADVVVFQTSEAKKYFSKKIQKRSVVIHNPIDDRFFAVRRNKVPRDIITVGRLEPQKNHKMLIDAFCLISDKIKGENLLIYGVGSLKKELQKYIDEKNMAERIVLMGETTSVERELAKARIFILSSDYEGMPNALMEAMAVGLPCVSTDCPCGGPRELIVDGKNGFLVPCGDVEKMGERIASIAKNDVDLKRVGDAARRDMYEKNRADVIIAKWEATIIGKMRGRKLF